MQRKCFRAVVVSAICAAMLAMAPPAGAQDASPWPRLPDGRVVIEAKGHRLAFDPEVRTGEVQFSLVPGPERLALSEVLADPARARARFEATAHSVWVWLSNAHNAPGRFLRRFDRTSVPDTQIFRIGLYPGDTATACAAPPWSGHALPARLCERFDRLARNPPALDEDGFVVDRPDFTRGIGVTFYILPAADRLSAAGEPVYFACGDVLRFCGNATGHMMDGYVFRPGVRLLYRFSTHNYPKPEWRAVDARFRAVLDDILLPADGTSRP